MPAFYTPMTIFIMPPGAFLVLACLVAAMNKINMVKAAKNGTEPKLIENCGDCATCGKGCKEVEK